MPQLPLTGRQSAANLAQRLGPAQLAEQHGDELSPTAEATRHLRPRWQDLFQAKFEVLLYDLTSTYIEGDGEEIPKAKYGYSRDKRLDCRQVIIALVITPEGFPLSYEVMEGNTSDRTTLRGFLQRIEDK